MHFTEILTYALRLQKTKGLSSMSTTERSKLRKRNAERQEAHRAMGLVK